MIPRRFFWILDFAVVAVAFCLAYELWPWLHHFTRQIDLTWLPAVLRPEPVTGELPPLRAIGAPFVIACLAAILMLETLNAYHPLLRQSRTRMFVYSVSAPLASAGVMTLFFFFEKKAGWSRLFLLTFIITCAVLLYVFRTALRQYFRGRLEAGFYTKKVLLTGPREGVRWLVDYFRETTPRTEYTITGYLAVPDDPAEFDPGTEMLGQASQLGDTLISRAIDEVIAVQGAASAEWMASIIENCDALGILLRIVPQALLFGKFRTLRTLYPFQILHLPAVVLAPPHFDSDALFFKRVFDIVLSAFFLVVLSPLFLLIAILIKLSDRSLPVFYRWRVVGRNGARFTGFKFTTMYPDADDRRKNLLDKNEMTGPVFKIKDDPRVTPVGRFLRKYSLNELPQLWSVLKGDMSLVGPRPAFPHELDGYGFWHKRKLSIRPGITCLWQVRGRNKISSFDDWVKMDLEYIDNWSLWLDFKILVRTAWAVVAGTGS
ncbi:MAG TPA: sugar transferase [Thermoanaerobaculia bacterium]|jgi:exopolysaccharide biosynthesis polyprenyl glycosylphosphotransferase|nr:sugar transferase [Thermoanaerobaculia bacterium]